MKTLPILLFWCLVLSSPALIAHVNGKTFRIASDWDIVLPFYDYVGGSFRASGRLPDVFPFAGTGLPVLGDPLSGVLNPFLIFPIIFFGTDRGIIAFYALAVFLSSIAMVNLMKQLGTSREAGVWAGMLYAASGVLPARFYAGHTIFWFTYALYPLLLAAAVNKRLHWRQSLGVGLLATIAFFSGDPYGIVYLFLSFGVSRMYWWLREPGSFIIQFRALCLSFAGFVLFSFPKLIAVARAAPRMTRFFSPMFGEGSIHAWLVPLQFLVPFGAVFWDRPLFRRIFDFHFNWYEYVAFLSPLPFVFLVALYGKKRSRAEYLLLLIVVAGALYIAQKYAYSPFYYFYRAVPALSVMRVPQRFAMAMVAPLVALMSLGANYWWSMGWRKKQVVAIAVGSLLWTMTVHQRMLANAFEKPHEAYHETAARLRAYDGGTFFVASSVCCLQRELTKEKIPMLNFYAALRNVDAPDFVAPGGEGFNYDMLARLQPTYMVAPKEKDLGVYGYDAVFETDVARVWRSRLPNIFPRI